MHIISRCCSSVNLAPIDKIQKRTCTPSSRRSTLSMWRHCQRHWPEVGWWTLCNQQLPLCIQPMPLAGLNLYRSGRLHLSELTPFQINSCVPCEHCTQLGGRAIYINLCCRMSCNIGHSSLITSLKIPRHNNCSAQRMMRLPSHQLWCIYDCVQLSTTQVTRHLHISANVDTAWYQNSTDISFDAIA